MHVNVERIPRFRVRFYRLASGREPVREWLKESLSREDCKAVGDDIRTVQFRWPLGMPLVRQLEKGLWEVRSSIRHGIARVLFMQHGSELILLHGFVKKTQRTPPQEIKLALERAKTVKEG